MYIEAPNIWRGYSDKEIQVQYLMRPFGGLKIEGELEYRQKTDCTVTQLMQGIGYMEIEDNFTVV